MSRVVIYPVGFGEVSMNESCANTVWSYIVKHDARAIHKYVGTLEERLTQVQKGDPNLFNEASLAALNHLWNQNSSNPFVRLWDWIRW